MRVSDWKQFWSGLVFLVIGCGTFAMLPTDLGTASAMGPGYFPMLLGLCLLILGGSSIGLSIKSRELIRIDTIPVVAVLFILAGIAAFSFLIKTWGLAIALAVLIGLGCYNRLVTKPLSVLTIYGLVLALTWFVFIYVIQLPITLGWQ